MNPLALVSYPLQCLLHEGGSPLPCLISQVVWPWQRQSPNSIPNTVWSKKSQNAFLTNVAMVSCNQLCETNSTNSSEGWAPVLSEDSGSVDVLRIVGLFIVERVTRRALLAAGGASSAVSLVSWRCGSLWLRNLWEVMQQFHQSVPGTRDVLAELWFFGARACALNRPYSLSPLANNRDTAVTNTIIDRYWQQLLLRIQLTRWIKITKNTRHMIMPPVSILLIWVKFVGLKVFSNTRSRRKGKPLVKARCRSFTPDLISALWSFPSIT